ncbi:MAG TPA: hypothetical protein QF549_02105 [Candidatus Saccharimonadaceae bacterium]|nr:hypothetical protein [Candidatus Saccharimonadaceae bacterium]
MRLVRAKKFQRRPGILGVFFLIGVMFTVGIVPVDQVGAAVWSGRGATNAYFSNGRYWSLTCRPGPGGACTGTPLAANNYVIPGLYGGNAFPESLDTVDELISFLKARTDSNSSSFNARWAKNGAAFVVHSMLGRSGAQANANGGRNVTAADYEQLRARLSGASINWFENNVSTDGVNTISVYGGGQFDVARDFQTRRDRAIVIRDQAGRVVYKILRRCANPIGAMNSAVPSVDFNLNPVVNTGSAYGEAGSTVGLNGSVNNTGTTVSANATWEARSLVVDRDDPTPSGSQIFSNNTANRFATGSRTFPRNVTQVPLPSRTLPDTDVGDRLCFVLSVNPRSHTSSSWAHSAVSCVVVAKSPKIQVLGGDVVVGESSADPDRILTSTTRKSVSGTNRTYGSWGEYAISATGSIEGMASGAGYSTGATSANFCTVSYLTLTNAGSNICDGSSPKGNFEYGAGLPDISARFGSGQSLGSAASVDLSDQSNGVYTTNRTINVNADNDIGVGRWVVINAPNQTVNITGDIRYTGAPLSSAADIPQVVIIANRINIRESVQRVDAWLIASGTNGVINTCSQISNPVTQLDAGRCDDRLTVNGPIAARQLLLYRTAGAGTGSASGDPAEVFNLRPDAYLWATYYSSTAGRIQTVSTQELPPRF